MNILVLAAHPDDETLGCGGTLKKFSEDRDNDVAVITFTDGGSARPGGRGRCDDLQDASNLLGFRVLSSFRYPDNELDSVPQLRLNKSVESILERTQFQPDMIITHNPWCLNIDHKRVFEVSQVIGRSYKCKHMCFEVPSSSEWNFTSDFRANCYVELNKDQVDAKMKTLYSCYIDEMRPTPHPRSVENLVSALRVNGSVVGVEYAEKFMSIKEVL